MSISRKTKLVLIFCVLMALIVGFFASEIVFLLLGNINDMHGGTASAPSQDLSVPTGNSNLSAPQDSEYTGETFPAESTPLSAAGNSEEPDENTTDIKNANELQLIIDNDIASLTSQWDVLVQNLSTGDTWVSTHNISKGQKMISASIIKLFIMGAVYEQVDKGALAEKNVYDDIYAMITISDNAAANRLTTLLGGGNADAGMALVNAFASEIGCDSSQQNRLMLANDNKQNYVTAADCATMLKLIYDGDCVSAEASAKMLEILKKQMVNDRLPHLLPKETVVAHKTGNLSGVSCADVGIIFSPNGDYILCCICNNQNTDQGATDKIAEISLHVYEYFNS